MPCRLWIKKESQPVFSSNKPSWTDKPWAVWSDGDTLDWAQTSKQINHIKVNKSLTGRTGPDRQRLIDGMVHTQKSQEKKGKKKKPNLDSFPLAHPCRICSSSVSHNTVVTPGPASVKFSQTNKDKHLLKFIIMENVYEHVKGYSFQPITLFI